MVVCNGFFVSSFDGQNIYVIYDFIWNVEGCVVGVDIGVGCGLLYCCVYGVLVVFDYENYWQILKGGYVEGFIDLILVCGIIVEIGEGYVFVVVVFVCKGQICVNWYLSVDDVMVVIEMFFFGKYMYRVVFVFGIVVFLVCEFGYYVVGIYIVGQYMVVVVIGSDVFVVFFCGGFKFYNNGFLIDIKVVEFVNEIYVIELVGFFFKLVDEQYFLVMFFQFVVIDIWFFCSFFCSYLVCFFQFCLVLN